MKKLYGVAIASMMMLALSGCAEETDDVISSQEEFVSFINDEIPAIVGEETEAVNAYNNFFSNNDTVDAEAFKTELEENIIPKYKDFMEQLENIQLYNDDVKELYSVYYDSMELQYEAIDNVYQALKEERDDYRDETVELLKQSSEKYDEFNSMVDDMASKYNIDIN